MSHLKKVLKGHKIVPIMAVTADVNTVYQVRKNLLSNIFFHFVSRKTTVSVSTFRKS